MLPSIDIILGVSIQFPEFPELVPINMGEINEHDMQPLTVFETAKNAMMGHIPEKESEHTSDQVIRAVFVLGAVATCGVLIPGIAIARSAANAFETPDGKMSKKINWAIDDLNQRYSNLENNPHLSEKERKNLSIKLRADAKEFIEVTAKNDTKIGTFMEGAGNENLKAKFDNLKDRYIRKDANKYVHEKLSLFTTTRRENRNALGNYAYGPLCQLAKLNQLDFDDLDELTDEQKVDIKAVFVKIAHDINEDWGKDLMPVQPAEEGGVSSKDGEMGRDIKEFLDKYCTDATRHWEEEELGHL